MSTARKIAKNTTVLFVSQIITYLLGFFITMYTARYLGVEGFGIIGSALALTGIFGVFADLGLGTVMVREVSREKSLGNKYLFNIAFLKFFLAFLMFGLIAITVYLVGYPPIVSNVVYIITLSVLIGGYTGILNAVFQANEKMEFISVGNVLNSGVMLLGTIIGISYGFDIIFFAVLYVISNLAVLFYIFSVYKWKFSFPKPSIDVNFWKPTLMLAIPLSIVTIFSMIAFRVDTILLSIIKGSVAVGWYTASYRLMEVFLFLPGVFAIAVFPVFSKFHVSSGDSLRFSYQKSFKYLTIISIPIAVGTTILASDIILLIYKSGFSESIIILQILIWTIPITFLNSIFGTIIPAMNRQNFLIKVTFISMLFNISLNLLLMPTYSYLAAAATTVFSELLVFTLCFYVLSKSFHLISLHKIVLKPVFASIVMGGFLRFSHLNLFLEILLGAIIYFVVLFLIKILDKEDWDIIKQILNIKKE